MAEAADIAIRPATVERWDDVARLAQDRGFTSGCWCMWWRVTNREYEERRGDRLRDDLHALVDDGTEPGLIAYVADTPAGWVAVAPRAEYPRLGRSAKLKPVDDTPVWSISCFYIDRRHRRRGLGEALLAAAVAHARAGGASTVEGYPIDTSAPAGGTSRRASADLYTGTLAMFQRAGFAEVARRGGRPIVRIAAG